MQEMISNNPEYFPFFFAVMWLVISYLLSFRSGWASLSKRYKSKTNFDGSLSHMKSLQIGGINYAGCVNVGVNDSELFLAVLLPFRLGHPPLIIPLNDINGQERKTIFSSYIILEFAGMKRPRIRISKRLADLIVSNSKGYWKYKERIMSA